MGDKKPLDYILALKRRNFGEDLLYGCKIK